MNLNPLKWSKNHQMIGLAAVALISVAAVMSMRKKVKAYPMSEVEKKELEDGQANANQTSEPKLGGHKPNKESPTLATTQLTLAASGSGGCGCGGGSGYSNCSGGCKCGGNCKDCGYSNCSGDGGCPCQQKSIWGNQLSLEDDPAVRSSTRQYDSRFDSVIGTPAQISGSRYYIRPHDLRLNKQ